MELAKFETRATMSSVEISCLTGKEHKDVLYDIRKMLIDLGNDTADFSAMYKAGNGQSYECFNLPRRECDLLLMGYSAKVRAAVYDRWQELEQGAFAIPKTLSGALRLAAEQAETIEAQLLQLEAQKPAVAFVERYVEAKSSKCLSDVAKILGRKPQEFIAELAADGVIFKRAGSWLPYQHQIDNERFTVQTGESNGHAFHQCRVAPVGIAWLAQKYGAKAAN
jgi:phage antirepressor YoqD-like protein